MSIYLRNPLKRMYGVGYQSKYMYQARHQPEGSAHMTARRLIPGHMVVDDKPSILCDDRNKRVAKG